MLFKIAMVGLVLSVICMLLAIPVDIIRGGLGVHWTDREDELALMFGGGMSGVILFVALAGLSLWLDDRD